MAKIALMLLSLMLLLLIMIASISAASFAEDAAAGSQNMEGIWIMKLGSEQVTMMISQNGSRLAGACTGGNAEPWNAVLMGMIAGTGVELRALSINRSGILVETEIDGDTNGEAINGSFMQGDSLGKVKSGEATGFKINPDASQYSPAATMAFGFPSSMNTQPKVAAEAEDGKESKKSKSRFVDVTTQKDRVLYLGWAWTPGEASDKAA